MVVGVGVRNGVLVGVGVSLGTKNVAVGEGSSVGLRIGLPWLAKAVGITNIGVDDGLAGKTNTDVELAARVCANKVFVGVALFCSVADG